MQVQTDPAFVNAKRFEYNIAKVEEKYPDGAPDHVIADLLMMTEEEVEKEWDGLVLMLRNTMGIRL